MERIYFAYNGGYFNCFYNKNLVEYNQFYYFADQKLSHLKQEAPKSSLALDKARKRCISHRDSNRLDAVPRTVTTPLDHSTERQLDFLLM